MCGKCDSVPMTNNSLASLYINRHSKYKPNSPCHGYLNSYTFSQRVILGVAVKGLIL